MDDIHKHVICIEKKIKRNPLYKCGSYLPHKMSKQPHKRTAEHKHRQQKLEPALPSQKLSYNDPANEEDTIPDGVAIHHFRIDFNFVRGSDNSVRTESGHTITSIDGFNSYLIIVNRVTRYL